MHNCYYLGEWPAHSSTALKHNFWQSGGTTAKNLYKCLGKYVDVESRPQDIVRAGNERLVQSGKVDIIFSSFPNFAVEQLFDEEHKTRILAMFRHPVDRLVSKFFYLGIATWERTYREDWKDMDPLEWVQTQNSDNNHMVKKLAGKVQRDTATVDDLIIAKETIRSRFIVGLMHEMEESIERFNIVMGESVQTIDIQILTKYCNCWW